MKAVFDPVQTKHNPAIFVSSGARQPSPEAQERADILRSAIQDIGLTIIEPPDAGMEAIATVHSARYLTFLRTIYERWRRIPDASEEVVPNLHPVVRPGEAQAGYPASAVGQTGYHIMDCAAPIGADTWASAYASAQSAVHAADLVAGGERTAYALCRPPGHHASTDMAGGFCFLNNAAIAAQRLRQHHARVAVLDVDVHHGNGTQQIFYQRPDVLTVSLHAHPDRFYPFFWGYAEETGSGEGDGFNLNLPLPRGTADFDYLATLETALAAIDAFSPSALILALGLDAHESDPFKGLAITTEGFGTITARIAALELPTVIVQEGGYGAAELGDNLKSALRGFAG